MGKRKREFIHFIDDIMDSIQKIEDYSFNLTEDDFLINFENKMLSLVDWKSSVKP
jgi:uncharacterized protein with HEPN domain